ncbi:MAG: hypothetical protein H0T46_18065 [Deltaproteobacteria bacterium]|nr:hypothetical protein [Deltaproteobacteria bacterium]
MIEQGGEPLGSAARALLDAAREGLAPDAAAAARVKAKVGAAAGASAGIGIAIKLGLLSVVAVVAVGGAIHVSRSRSAETPAIALPAGGSESPPPSVRPTATMAAPAEPASTDLRAAPGEPDLAIEMAPQSAARTRPVVQPSAGIDLAREVQYIDLAMTALKSDDIGAALKTIAEYERETRGAGQLAEDAAAIKVEALCRIASPAAAGNLAVFDERFPRSAQRSRLTTVCK